MLTESAENALREKIVYGGQKVTTVEGFRAVDSICFNGLAMPQGKNNAELCIPKKAIVAVDKVVGLANMQADGVLGLSPVGSDSFL